MPHEMRLQRRSKNRTIGNTPAGFLFEASEQVAKAGKIFGQDNPVRILGRLLQTVVNTGHSGSDRKPNPGTAQAFCKDTQKIKRGAHFRHNGKSDHIPQTEISSLRRTRAFF